MNTTSLHPVIVIAAFNRAHSLQRLLTSLQQADLPQHPTTLVISIDKSDNPSVLKAAEDYEWRHGEKKIIVHEQRLGLRAHILSCGDLTAEYGSIILLEDDLFASKYFYGFAEKALNFYNGETRIAGISLYCYDMAENGFNPFTAVDDGADVYFMQVASSWGQAWTREQWVSFKEWLAEHPDMSRQEMPPHYLFNWSENSWKKHFIRYLHHTGRFFVFPRHSFTTNFEDPGATASTKGLYQVPLTAGKREIEFISLDDSKSVYDACFEMQPECLKKWCPFLVPFDFVNDIAGIRPLEYFTKPYALTSKNVRAEIYGFSLEMFPPVLNVICNVNGNRIFLAKKENILSENVASDSGYYKYKPVSEIIFKDELVQRVEKVHEAHKSEMDELHRLYTAKMEDLNKEIRQLHHAYHLQIEKLHTEYSEKIKSEVSTALRNYQFALDYPRFTIVTFIHPGEESAAVQTAETVVRQNYPRFKHKLILIGKAEAQIISGLGDNENRMVEKVNNAKEANDVAAHFFNDTESDYHCLLSPGTLLLPESLSSVRQIFKRFAEVNWLKGMEVSGSENKSGNHMQTLVPSAASADFRWDKMRFLNSGFQEIRDTFNSGIFWKKHLWEKSGGMFTEKFPNVAAADLFYRFFKSDQLYIVMAYLSASAALKIPEEAQQEFIMLKNEFPAFGRKQKLLAALGKPFFKRNIPVLRAIHKSQCQYPPLIRFDFNTRSFYLSDY